MNLLESNRSLQDGFAPKSNISPFKDINLIMPNFEKMALKNISLASLTCQIEKGPHFDLCRFSQALKELNFDPNISHKRVVVGKVVGMSLTSMLICQGFPKNFRLILPTDSVCA